MLQSYMGGLFLSFILHSSLENFIKSHEFKKHVCIYDKKSVFNTL